MVTSNYQIRQCNDPSCGLRYPYLEDYSYGKLCPRCGGVTAMMNVYQRFHEELDRTLDVRGRHIEAMLDNVRSAWNVGSMFRTAEGFGIRKMHLCGITPTPENHKVAKTSLGAEKVIKWQYYPNALSVADNLIQNNTSLWAVEVHDQSIVLEDNAAIPKTPLVLVMGNENCGIDPELLERCEQVIKIPMFGAKRSLNVAVAFGIVTHYLQSIQSI
jgi:tRNA G18 (ribose-2'-O)-methylase SpoU